MSRMLDNSGAASRISPRPRRYRPVSVSRSTKRADSSVESSRETVLLCSCIRRAISPTPNDAASGLKHCKTSKAWVTALTVARGRLLITPRRSRPCGFSATVGRLANVLYSHIPIALDGTATWSQHNMMQRCCAMRNEVMSMPVKHGESLEMAR